MRHNKSIRKFGREAGQRNALIRSLAVSFFSKEKIKTTEAKAKELRPFVEKIVTKSKEKTLARERLVMSNLGSWTTVRKLFDKIGPKYKERAGGYTRITKLPRRLSDGSKMAIIELI
ncbi:MAG: 50S ribosomal protein L17 [Candidatus Paceibacterota bacterium]